MHAKQEHIVNPISSLKKKKKKANKIKGKLINSQ